MKPKETKKKYQNTNKLNTANGMFFGYDNNGNTTTEAARQYVYNQNQRLVQVNDGAITANYTYNGNSQRVKKVVNGVMTVFHYSLSGQIIAESTSSGTVAAEYVFLNGQPLAKIEGSNVYYYHNDHLGTPQVMTDSAGVVKWRADYKPFGEATIDQTVTTITNNLRFPGQYYDVETGLHYNYFRDYNPVNGRYIESDPIGIKRGRNHLYVYVNDNPISKYDTYGLSETCAWLGFSATIAVGVGVQIVHEGGRCVNDCGHVRYITRTCFCACLGVGASASGQGETGSSSSDQEGWSVATPYVTISGSGSSVTGIGVGPGAGLFYCWCGCINH